MGRLPDRRRPDEGPIPREQIFEILSNERRRFVLRYLKERDNETRVAFRDLVDQVAAWENETTRDRLTSSDRKCVYTALRQTHLPKLHQFGLVEFDNRRGHVEPTEITGEMYPYMDYVPERERFRSRFHLSLAVGGVLSALLVWVGDAPFSGLPEFAVLAAVAVAVGAAAAATAYRRRFALSGLRE